MGDYIIIDGLAAYAKQLFGEELLGPWVTSFDEEDLQYSTEIIKNTLDIKGFVEQGYQPACISPFVGYAVGYKAVQSFMKVNKVGISEATLLGTDVIIRNHGLFR